MKNFSQRLNYACDLANLPPTNKGRQTELAKMLTVSNEAVSKWFSGEAKPRQAKSDKLSKVLKVDSAWLFMGIGEPTSTCPSNTTLTLMDQLAIHALNAILNSSPNMDEEIIAKKAYSIARHMLEERDQTTT